MPKRKRKSKQKDISIKGALDGWQQLVKAARNGRNDRIQALLDLGVDLNANEHINGYTALHFACKEKQLGTVKFLVERGANVQARTFFGDTPFLKAFDYSEDWEYDLRNLPLELLQFLVDHGADVNDVNSDGETAMHKACKEHGNGALRLVKFLVENGAKAVGVQDKEDGHTAFVKACWTGGSWTSPAIVQFLIESGVDLTVKYNDTIALHTWTMHWACQHCFLDIVKMLKNQYGPADLNAFANFSGKRPLHLACYGKYHKEKLKTAKYLIENGVKVNDATDKDGMTPLYHYQLKLETAEFLIAHTDDLNSKDKYGRTALLHHCWYSGWDIGKALIENGADIHMDDNDGNTPLHFACKNEGLEIVKLLLSRGANVNLTNKEGKTPLQLACQENCLDVVWFLLRQQPWLVTE